MDGDVTQETLPAKPSAAEALDAWLDTLRDTAVSRDTGAWNSVFSSVQQIKAVIAAVKES